MEATASAARRRRSSALIVTLASLTFAVLFGAAPARAADECSPAAVLSPLPFSSFQGADGDQCNTTGIAGSDDWQKIVADGGFGTGGGTTLIDNDSATGLNVFKGGSKEQEPQNWGFTSDFPNNKTNILAAWGYPDAQPDHLFLYLAFAREEASGSVNYNFELNQNAPTETFTTSQGATAIKRRAGDILIAYDRTGNSSVVINLCRWLPSDPAQAHLDGTWSGCANVTASGLAQGETNLNFPITNFLQGGGSLAAGQFGEAAVDLTAALQLGGPGQAPCADFGAFWVRSRQSGSITSDPSDFIAPSKIGVNNCGRVIVRKTTVGAETVPPTKFDFSANFNAVAEGTPDATPNAFQLAGGDTQTVVKVQPGTYSVVEADPAAKGYDLTGLTCTETGAVSNVATTTSLATRTATLEVDAGEEITCTYANTRRGRLIVEKQTFPDGDPASFGFTTGTGPFALTDGQTTTLDVLPGTYAVTESAKTGWSLSGLTCDDADSSADKAARTATFRIAAGEVVRCTFTNTKDGRLIVEKQTLPDGDPASFGFTTTATGNGTFSLSDGATESRDVKPGSYTVSEATASGYRLDQVSCSDADSTGDKTDRLATFDIAPGETVTCTFLNRSISANAVVVKAGNEWSYHGDMLTFTFTVNNSGQSPLTNVTVSDNRCAQVTLKAKRDINGNPDTTPDVLHLTDTWIYECSMPAPDHAAGETNPIVNTVTVTALDEFQRPVSDTDQHSTLLIHPAIAIDKTGPAGAQAGQPVQYTLVVTNPGDVPFLAPNVSVSDALCDAPPLLSTKNGDSSPAQLDPGERWTYTCTVQTQVGQTVVNNVGAVTATDSYGAQEVTDDDPATTQLSPPRVAPPPPPPPVALASSGTPVPQQVRPVAAAVATATARLSGPKRCVSGPFEAKVSGRGIAKVLFLLDGRKIKTVAGSADRTLFEVRINPRGQSSKAHRIIAQVTFKPATRTRRRTLRFVYLRCARRIAAPQYTG